MAMYKTSNKRGEAEGSGFILDNYIEEKLYTGILSKPQLFIEKNYGNLSKV